MKTLGGVIDHLSDTEPKDLEGDPSSSSSADPDHPEASLIPRSESTGGSTCGSQPASMEYQELSPASCPSSLRMSCSSRPSFTTEDLDLGVFSRRSVPSEWAPIRHPSRQSKHSRSSDENGESMPKASDRLVTKARFAAEEILTTETSYVQRLHLLDQVFHLRLVQENRKSSMIPYEVIPQIFSNLKSLYQFHHSFLLPELKARIENWNNNPRLGDIMRRFAPFFKMYTEYVNNFEHGLTVLDFWLDKSPRFRAFIHQIQEQEVCGRLSLQHHLIEPIHRLPRYILLLKEYLKYLGEHSDDQEDTLEAIRLVDQAACHSEEIFTKLEQFDEVLKVSKMLGLPDLLSQQLLRKGPMMRVSGRSAELRYLYLMNDVLLVCQPYSSCVKIPTQCSRHVVELRLTLHNMEVWNGDGVSRPYTFQIRNKEQTLIEFQARSEDESLNWQVTLWRAIGQYAHRKRAHRVATVPHFTPVYIEGGREWRSMQHSNTIDLPFVK